LILSLVSTIFSLRFLTEQAAVMPHDGNGRAEERTRALARWLRFLLHIGAGILCGPVAALSIFLASVVAVDFLGLSHLFARAGEEHVAAGVLEREYWATLILSIVAAAVGSGARCVAGNSGSGTTWRRIWSSLAVVGTVFAVFLWGVDWIPHGAWLGLLEVLHKQLKMPLDTSGAYWMRLGEMEFIASILLVMLQSAFYLLALIMLAALVVWLVAIASAPAAWRPALGVAYAAALVQLGLWLLLVPVLGLAEVFTIFKSVSTNTSHAEILLRSVQRGLALHLAFLMIVSAVAAFVWFCRARWSRTRPMTWKGPPYDYPTPKPDIPRLLVHRLIIGALVVVGAFGSALSLVNLVWAAAEPPRPSVRLYDIATQLAGLLVSFLLLIFTLVLPGVRAWLHILVDVINHFYRRRERLPLPFGPEHQADVHDFEVQQRIECRFRAVLKTLLNDPEMTHLTVVAHSQGTMVAVDVFSLTGLHDHNRKSMTERLASLEGLHLITMGSPLTHLYQHYFPNRYPPLDDHCWGGLKSTIRDWVNVYRVDDFVGTFVGPSVGLKGGEYPANVPIEPGGHTAYWRRPSVFNLELLRNRLPGYSSPLETTGQSVMAQALAVQVTAVTPEIPNSATTGPAPPLSIVENTAESSSAAKCRGDDPAPSVSNKSAQVDSLLPADGSGVPVA
jgi:hypothetical protein